jgi:hypothetical protein
VTTTDRVAALKLACSRDSSQVACDVRARRRRSAVQSLPPRRQQRRALRNKDIRHVGATVQISQLPNRSGRPVAPCSRASSDVRTCARILNCRHSDRTCARANRRFPNAVRKQCTRVHVADLEIKKKKKKKWLE